MATQLRRYTINRGRMDDFLRAWMAGVHPLRLKYGFRIDGTWIIRERNEFIWLVSYDGIDWDGREAEFRGSPERAAVDPDPAQYIAKNEHWFITEVLPQGTKNSHG
jgi:hypothetical protein